MIRKINGMKTMDQKRMIPPRIEMYSTLQIYESIEPQTHGQA